MSDLKLSDFEFTGEFRHPKKGEWFLCDVYEPLRAVDDGIKSKRPILRKKAPQPQTINADLPCVKSQAVKRYRDSTGKECIECESCKKWRYVGTECSCVAAKIERLEKELSDIRQTLRANFCKDGTGVLPGFDLDAALNRSTLDMLIDVIREVAKRNRSKEKADDIIEAAKKAVVNGDFESLCNLRDELNAKAVIDCTPYINAKNIHGDLQAKYDELLAAVKKWKRRMYNDPNHCLRFWEYGLVSLIDKLSPPTPKTADGVEIEVGMRLFFLASPYLITRLVSTVSPLVLVDEFGDKQTHLMANLNGFYSTAEACIAAKAGK